MSKYILLSLYTLIILVCTIKAQDQRGQFKTFKHKKYIASESYNFIANITGDSVSTLARCIQQCLQNILCETVTYYMQLRKCILYRERYGLGQLVSVPVETATVISLTYRYPTAKYCTLATISDVTFLEGQFMYSPNRLYAFGMIDYTLGTYRANANGSVGSAIWLPSVQQPAGSCFRAQFDGQLVLYKLCTISVWDSDTMNAGNGPPYCLTLSNAGQLSWYDRRNQLVWNNP